VNEAAANALPGTIFAWWWASGMEDTAGSDDLILSGLIDEWTNDEYWNLNRTSCRLPPPTRYQSRFDSNHRDRPDTGNRHFLMCPRCRSVGQEGSRRHGVEIVMPGKLDAVPPPERALKLQRRSVPETARRLSKARRPAAFGIAIPSGTVYAIPSAVMTTWSTGDRSGPGPRSKSAAARCESGTDRRSGADP